MLLAACPSEPGRDPGKATPDAGPAPAAAGPKPIAEAEPNDESAKAQPVTAPAIVEATLGPKDADWFRLPAAAAPRTLRIDARSDTADLSLELFDADRNQVQHARAAPAKAPEVLAGVVQKGDLYVKVSAVGEGAPYRLLVEATPPVPGGEAEPNDRAVDATPLSLGPPGARGTLSFEEDADFYRLDVPPAAAEGERRALRVDLSAVAELRPVLQVLDGDQAPLGEAKARDTGAGVSFRNLALRADVRSPLYLVVRSAYVSKTRRTANPDVAYVLQVTLEPAAADLEEEPNDEPQKATVLDPAGKGRLGFLAPAGDEDVYSVTVDRARVGRFDLSGVDRVDLVLEVIDPEKEKNEELLRVNDGGLREGEILADVYLQPGTTYLRVSGASRKLDGKWVRDFENPEQTYTLGWTLRDALPGDEREPNDDGPRANELHSGVQARGMLHPRKDVDVWKLVVPPGPARPLSATLSGLTKVDVGLYLHEATPEGKEGKLLASADRAKETAEEKLVAQVEGGTYLLVVKDTRGGVQSNWTDSYKLDVAVGE